MKLSVFFHHVKEAAAQTGRSLPQMLDWIKSLGIDYVELGPEDVQNPRQTKKLLDAAGLQASSLYWSYDMPLGAPVDGRKQIEAAKILGCRRILAVAGFYHDAVDRSLQDQRTADALQSLCAQAAAAGLTVTVEDYDHEKSPTATILQLKNLFSAVSDLQYTFDTGNFLVMGEDALQGYAILADRITHVHLKDRAVYPHALPKNPGDRQKSITGVDLYPAAVGSGVIPMEEILSRLQASGYNGIYAMEFFGAADYQKAIADSVSWLKLHLT